MKKEDIKALTVVVIICLVIVGIIIIINYKSNSEKLEPVNDYNTYFSTYIYINDYINSTNNTEKINGILYNDIDESDNSTKNIDSFLTNNKLSIKIKEMKFVKIKDNYLYYVKGKILENGFNSVKTYMDNYEIILLYDYNELTYAVYPIIDNNSKKIINNIKKIHIEQNKYNKLKETSLIGKEKICSLYIDDYINYLTTDINRAYELLSDEIKKEQFTSVDEFKKYIYENIDKITTSIDKCRLEKIKENRIYSVIDKNGNRFVFTEKSVFDYNVEIYIKKYSSINENDDIETEIE